MKCPETEISPFFYLREDIWCMKNLIFKIYLKQYLPLKQHPNNIFQIGSPNYTIAYKLTQSPNYRIKAARRRVSYVTFAQILYYGMYNVQSNSWYRKKNHFFAPPHIIHTKHI